MTVAPTGGFILQVVGGKLSGTITMSDMQPGPTDCQINMQGIDGNWAGWWACTGYGQPLHASTAIATRMQAVAGQ